MESVLYYLSSIQVPPTHGSHLNKCLDSTELLELEPVILRPSRIIPKQIHYLLNASHRPTHRQSMEQERSN